MVFTWEEGFGVCTDGSVLGRGVCIKEFVQEGSVCAGGRSVLRSLCWGAVCTQWSLLRGSLY